VGLVSGVDGVVGFVTIWKRYQSPEPDDDPSKHGFVSDLVVLAAHRGRGLGRALVRAAAGFEPSEIHLEKRLTSSQVADPRVPGVVPGRGRA
jgi:ribosomal protein S18 acetylase RimI-like enzyme